MTTIANYPYAELQFTKEGTLFQAQAADALLQLLADKQITDLLVISHGWDNDMNEARDLYNRLVPLIAAEVLKRPELAHRTFAVAGVLWPSKKFAEEDLIAGGGAASVELDTDTDALIEQLRAVQQFFDGDDAPALVQAAINEVPHLSTDENARRHYVSLMQNLLAKPMQAQTGEPEDQSANLISTVEPQELLVNLSDVQLVDTSASVGGAADLTIDLPIVNAGDGGAAAGGEGMFSGLVNGARNLLNFATYYQMKKRAGSVGVSGLHPVLARIRHERPDCRLHLIGHSFGARLVTAATAGPDETSELPVNTLSLLQGAFSHYGLAKNYEPGKDGFFRSVLTQHKVSGPIVISQTHNDKAVGIAYAIASRIAGQIGAFLGDENDPYGGMGANGAQLTPEANTQFNLTLGSVYAFQPGQVYNLNADQTIGDHSDICHPQVATAIVSAIVV